MELGTDDDHSRILVSQGHHVSREPFVHLLSAFGCFDNIQILQVVAYDEIWPVRSMFYSSNRIVDACHRYSRSVIGQNNGNGTPFVIWFLERSEVSLEQFVGLKLHLDVGEVLLRLAFGLGDYQYELLLLYAEYRPDGIRGTHDGGLA